MHTDEFSRDHSVHRAIAVIWVIVAIFFCFFLWGMFATTWHITPSGGKVISTLVFLALGAFIGWRLKWSLRGYFRSRRQKTQ